MRRLHRALLQAGMESRLYHRRGHLPDPQGQALEFAQTSSARLRERLKWRVENWLLKQPGNLFSPVRSPARTPLPANAAPADIYHLHWISRWLDLPSFMASLPPAAPVVLTVHDWGNLTGGCHLYSGCLGFQKDCRPCPLLKAPFDRWLAHQELQRKQRSLQPHRIYVVGNSRWTTSMAASATVLQTAVSCRTIHPAIEPADFVRHDKATAKKMLGIAPECLTIGFGCAALTDANKNFPAFLEVLGRLSRRREVAAVVFGDGFREPDAAPAKIHALGKLASSRLLSLAYSAMDVFVLTSGIETFGQVALEAQACGTPVCAFEVGGLSDAIRNGETGCLSPLGDLDALTANVSQLLENEELRRRFGQAGHDWTRATFTQAAATAAYLKLYQEASGHADH